MKIDPHMQQQKCRQMILVSGNIRHMRILAGVPLGGASNESGVVDDGNFCDLSVTTSSETSEKAINIIWRYATPCWPVTDCKMNDLG